MSGTVVGLGGILLMILLILIRMPIGFAMAGIGFTGLLIMYGGNMQPVIGTFGTMPFSTGADYSFSVIPLFVLMGLFAYNSGISTEIYDTAKKWMGHWPGGLSVVTIGACAGFSAVSGSSVATAATVGTMTIPEMRRSGVSDALATGAVAAGGTLGIMIPPSGLMVLYALMSDQSVAKLLVAGILPGLMLAVAFILVCALWAILSPTSASPLPRASWRERFQSLKGTFGILVLFLLVMGGIYGGIFTVTEAAAAGAAGAFIITALRRKLSWPMIRQALLETGRTTCMILMIVIGAHIFNIFLSVTQITTVITDFLGGLDLPVTGVLFVILLVFILMGCVLDSLGMVVMMVPIILPTIVSLGLDPIWFGVVVVLVMEMGLITPPIGINVFVIKDIARDIPLGKIFKGITPFLLAQIAVVSLLIFYPALPLWLVSLMPR
ncbi:MAG: TRAP transporter large permease [Alphaproteobacteria bacterium]|nr:MAG: TRAP transporter large permease [Alphaproteobacteria bacterium]